MKLRIKFIKKGAVRFIGHLDVMRYFQKALRRAEIDVTYTAGFSPHQIMSFAAPLGVGIESNGEYMDIGVDSLPEAADNMTSCELLVRRLNAVGVRGLEAVEARVLPEDAGNAMASVAAAAYTVRFREGQERDIPQEAVDAFLSRERIPVTKETKRGVREIDLRPGIYEFTWQDGAFRMLLDASSAGNIKPSQVLEAFFAGRGQVLPENALRVVREDIYTVRSAPDRGSSSNQGNASDRECASDRESAPGAGAGRFIPLGEIGGVL